MLSNLWSFCNQIKLLNLICIVFLTSPYLKNLHQPHQPGLSLRGTVSGKAGNGANLKLDFIRPHILDQQRVVMLPSDPLESPQIKGVCSDSHKCHGCQSQDEVTQPYLSAVAQP